MKRLENYRLPVILTYIFNRSVEMPVAFLITCFFSCITVSAQIVLPRLISDGMVLQRETPIRIWGKAAPGEKVTISFRNKKYSTRSDQEGNWKVMLPSQKAGGPYEFVFNASNEV